jgi:hypothetical protein
MMVDCVKVIFDTRFRRRQVLAKLGVYPWQIHEGSAKNTLKVEVEIILCETKVKYVLDYQL